MLIKEKLTQAIDTRRFEPNSVVEKLKDVVYSPFDPDLKIVGEKIRFIVNIAIDPASLHYDHFKN